MPRDRQALARHWMALAIGALVVSGALSLGVVLWRVPSVARHLTDTALALLLAGGASRAPDQSATLRRVAVLYGGGQLAFSTGLVLAGSYGLGRKTYGIEQHIGHAGQRIGLWVMAAGGVLAFAGGAVWAVATMRRLRRSATGRGGGL